MFKLSTVEVFKHVKLKNSIELDDAQLHALQNTLYEIMQDIISVCEKHNICYTLGGGSVLGAVRHKGFIPWDDDIDMNMPRKDYLKFIEVFPQEMGNKYWVHTPENTKNYNLLLCRVRKKGTSVVTREDFFNDECGAFVDIFVVENTFDHPLLRTIHGIGCMGLGLVHSCRKFYAEREFLKTTLGDDVARVFKIKIALGFLVSFLPMQTWTRLINRWNGLCKNDNSKYVSIPVGRKHFFGELYLREDVCQTKSLMFKDMVVNCPMNTDMYLTALYGDYMQIPKDADKEKHIFFNPFDLGK